MAEQTPNKTYGRLDTGQVPRVPGPCPCNDPIKTSPELDAAMKLKAALASSDPAQIDEIIRTTEAQKIVQDSINQLQARKTTWRDDVMSGAGNPLGTAGRLLLRATAGDEAVYQMDRQGAGIARGVLGVANRLVFGLADLVKFAAKHNPANPYAVIHDALDMTILKEHLRLGNICMACVQHEAKAMGKELVKPVTEPWSKGEYAEAITAGGLELAMILGPIVAKVGSMMKAAQAAKAAEAIKAAEAAEAAKAADAVKAADAAKAANAAKAKAAPKGAAVDKLPAHKPYTSKEPLYRGDGRNPSEIFDDGFTSRGDNTDLLKYQRDNAPSVYVPTSTSEAVASNFADMQGAGSYVYKIDPRGLTGVDINASIGNPVGLAHEVEIAVVGKIPPQNIINARPVLPDGTLGKPITNPKYTGSGN
jgi:Pertussis toxin, subunit 1